MVGVDQLLGHKKNYKANEKYLIYFLSNQSHSTQKFYFCMFYIIPVRPSRHHLQINPDKKIAP